MCPYCELSPLRHSLTVDYTLITNFDALIIIYS